MHLVIWISTSKYLDFILFQRFRCYKWFLVFCANFVFKATVLLHSYFLVKLFRLLSKNRRDQLIDRNISNITKFKFTPVRRCLHWHWLATISAFCPESDIFTADSVKILTILMQCDRRTYPIKSYWAEHKYKIRTIIDIELGVNWNEIGSAITKAWSFLSAQWA